MRGHLCVWVFIELISSSSVDEQPACPGCEETTEVLRGPGGARSRNFDKAPTMKGNVLNIRRYGVLESLEVAVACLSGMTVKLTDSLHQ